MKEEWIPQVDDWIVITKSDDNWAESFDDMQQMDAYVGLVVKITKTDRGWDTQFINNGNWSWNYHNKHYRKAEPHEIPGYIKPTKETYKYLIPIINNLNENYEKKFCNS
jgi:hypothetical protein